MANELRKLNIKADLNFTNRKIAKVLNIASKEEIPFVIVLGENEINNNEFNLKNMFTGEEVKFNLNDYNGIANHIKTTLNK